MSVFAFLRREWPTVYEAAADAESAAHPDPRTACFHARRALELAVAWIYKHDGSLKLPYEDNLSALIHDPTFKASAGDAVFTKARLITRLGNQAVHNKPVSATDSVMAVRELFHVAYWMVRTYGRLTRRSRTYRSLRAAARRSGMSLMEEGIYRACCRPPRLCS
jgi:type I restriction enzyme R subunit